MAGRYPSADNVAQHPAFEEGAAASAENHEKHLAIAAGLCPDGLDTARRRVWDRVAPELSKAGRLKPLFIDFVAEYCEIKVRMDQARAYLDSEGIGWKYKTVGRHGHQLKARPEVAQYNDDWRKWNTLVNQLGLSPATELRFNDRQGSLFDDDFGRL